MVEVHEVELPVSAPPDEVVTTLRDAVFEAGVVDSVSIVHVSVGAPP